MGVAFVAHCLLNQNSKVRDGAHCAGVYAPIVQLPDDGYPAEVTRPLLAEVAEQVEEFSRRGYGFILVGERDGLAEALALVGVAVPDRIVPASAAELREFLAVQPVPSALGAARDRPGQAATASPE
jgi:hypothetical protein